MAPVTDKQQEKNRKARESKDCKNCPLNGYMKAWGDCWRCEENAKAQQWFQQQGYAEEVFDHD